MFDKNITKNYGRRRSRPQHKPANEIPEILKAIVAFLFFIGLCVIIDDIIHHRPIFQRANTPYRYYRR